MKMPLPNYELIFKEFAETDQQQIRKFILKINLVIKAFHVCFDFLVIIYNGRM